MNQNVKRLIRMFWLWRESDEIEWLHQMSLDGWHLSNVNGLIYSLTKGEPKDLLYHWDFIPQSKQDHHDYVETFKDAGWHLVCHHGSTFYFSSPSDNKYKDVYTDHQSRSKKYKMLLLMHIILFPMVMTPLFILSKGLKSDATPFIPILALMNLIILVFLVFSTYKLILYVARLNQSIKE